jgi:hypothetical protein
MTNIAAPAERTLASVDEIRHALDDLDDAKLLAIMALRPTILDIEQASVCLNGDADVFGVGQPLPSGVGDIIATLTADEEDEPLPTR